MSLAKREVVYADTGGSARMIRLFTQWIKPSQASGRANGEMFHLQYFGRVTGRIVQRMFNNTVVRP
jgi:hypothetical protein